MSPAWRERPAGNQALSDVSFDGDRLRVTPTADIIRCTRCQHPIHAPESVRLGLGPVCRQVVAA